MTKDEALKIALEALEWSYGGEPMPSKELEAINAIRQVLSQPDRSQTAGYAKKIEQLIKQRDELRQALAEWTPDDTAYRPDGLRQEELLKMSSGCLMNGMAFMKAGEHVPVDEVIDRGAWDDVPDVINRLRDEKYDLIDKFLRNHLDDEWYPTYSNALERIYHAPYKPPKREWQGLTAEDYRGMSKELANFAREIEAKLKEKNHG